MHRIVVNVFRMHCFYGPSSNHAVVPQLLKPSTVSARGVVSSGGEQLQSEDCKVCTRWSYLRGSSIVARPTVGPLAGMKKLASIIYWVSRVRTARRHFLGLQNLSLLASRVARPPCPCLLACGHPMITVGWVISIIDIVVFIWSFAMFLIR